MNCDLISIIIPVYNVEKYLKRALETVIKQTYKNLEIIIVNDGSTDSSQKICDEYKEKDDRIKIINKSNGGLSDARNYGISKATGKYITFIDSDDYIEIDYVEYLYNLVKKYKTRMSICAHTVIYDNGNTRSVPEIEDRCWSKFEILEDILYSKNFEVSAWAKLYDLKLFENVRYPKGKIFEDVDTTYKLIDKCDNIAIGFKSKYNYIMRKDSITNIQFSNKHMYMIEATEHMCNYLCKYETLECACKRRITYSYFSTLNRMINSNNRNDEIEKKLREKILNNIEIIKDKKVSKRDKIGMIALIPGVNFYKRIWNFYQKKTGRK